MFDTKELGDILLSSARLAGYTGFNASNFRSYIKVTWKIRHQELNPSMTFENFWKLSRQKGGYFEEFKPSPAILNNDVYALKFATPPQKDSGLTLLAVNSNLHNANAKGANRTWLMEIPHPVTQVVWDSWVEIHPETAIGLGIKHGDLVEISSASGKVQAAAWVFYGIDKNSVAMPAGMGRKVAFPNYKTAMVKGKVTPVVEMGLKIEEKTVGINVMTLLPGKMTHYPVTLSMPERMWK